MCNSTIRARHGAGLGAVAQIDGRPVLQPACNRVVTLEAAARPAKKPIPLAALSGAAGVDIRISDGAATDDHTDASDAPSIAAGAGPAPPSTTGAAAARPASHAAKASVSSASPKLGAADAKPVHRRSDVDPNGLNSSGEKPASPTSCTQSTTAATVAALRKKSKKYRRVAPPAAHSARSATHASLSFVADEILAGEPGSIAAAQREQAMLRKAQRKMRIAHYGRAPGKVAAVPIISSPPSSAPASEEERRCSFITSNSDPIYVAYHDQEWGVPVHDDKMLFELLVLAGAQVGFDWTTILKKRDDFRAAFAGFDAEEVAKFNERQMAAVSADYRIDVGRVRSVVDNANRILELKAEFGSLDAYAWGFVSHQPISTRYGSCRKIPVKTSKSEAISRDMVRRGFRFAGPTVIHSFMQAAGLTNDHLLSCPRRLQLLQHDYHHHHFVATTDDGIPSPPRAAIPQ